MSRLSSANRSLTLAPAQRLGFLQPDVVGLGKSMMATALAKVFEDKNLVTMWEDYAHR